MTSYMPPKLMARPASLPCPDCEGMLTAVVGATPLACACGASLRVTETREDPEHPLAAAVWRHRSCPAGGHDLFTVQFLAPAEDGPGARQHACQDCGAAFTSLERLVDPREAQERLAALARERMMLARAGRRFSHPRGRQQAVAS